MTAGRQTMGRGRRGRHWSTEVGNLAASLALVDPADAEIASQFWNLVKAGATISETGEGVAGSRAREIQQRSDDEFARLVKEFDEAIGR